MTNTKTEDVEATVAQILSLEKAGCDIIRCAVPTMEAAKALSQIKKQIHIPLVADIHFDYRLAIAAMENGADKIRINPGNIGSKERIQAVVDKVLKIEEDMDFGCEERQPGEALMSVVLVEDENGNETSLRHDDGLLYERDINEGDFVTMDGQHQLWKL